MSIKKYGIYLAYPPHVDLRHEGLGRHLSEFLKGAQSKESAKFVIACPSWMQSNLIDLFISANIAKENIEFISPKKQPLILTLYNRYILFSKKKTRSINFIYKIKKITQKNTNLLFYNTKKSLLNIRSLNLINSIALLLLVILLPALTFIYVFIKFIILMVRKIITYALKPINTDEINRLILTPRNLKNNFTISSLYDILERNEIELIQKAINTRVDINVWYCPTCFWPHFNYIKGPRVTCVPDVVLTNFAVGFSLIGGDRFSETFRAVEKSILQGKYFITYSEDVKWRTLVEKYHINPKNITVIRHGANRLDDLLRIKGSQLGIIEASDLCFNYYLNSLKKSIGNSFIDSWRSKEINYIFYASQFRPNKNILSLLKAFNFIVKNHNESLKLIMTGNPLILPEINEYINNNKLHSQILCLHGLSIQELASLYKMAKLAVNPSLSEGGFPFTFTEALSVDTPVVMAKIAVTEEIVTSSELKDIMLFDPYNWLDMSQKILWSLDNQEYLLEKQKILYEQLKSRNWSDVVNEHLNTFDNVSNDHRE